MKKMIDKRARATIGLSAVIALIFSFIFANLYFDAASAASDQGNGTTARQKVYYLAMKKCNTNTLWASWNGSKTWGNLNNVVNGTTSFYDPTADAATANSFWLEYHLKNKTMADIDYGTFLCSSEKGKLAQTSFLQSNNMGFSQRDLICGTDGNKGLYESATDTVSCGHIYDHANDASGNAYDIVLNSSRSNFFDTLVKQKTFGGNPPGGSMSTFTDLEMYYVYHDAFFTACADFNEKVDSGVYEVELWDDSTNSFKKYHFQQKHSGIKPDDQIWLYEGNRKSCDYLAKALDHGNSHDAFKQYMESSTTPSPSDPSGPSSPSDPTAPGDPTSSTSSEPTCLTEAGPMGWVLCPATEGGASSVDGLYSFLEGQLELKAELFSSNDSGARQAWNVFVGIANAGLIIVLLLIIFSQLTGVGIDNYGIKKILPRLIIGILLVEASFLIAQAAVDVSNIVGSSVARLFQQIADNIDHNFEASAKITFSAIFGSLLGIIGVAGVAAPTVISVIAVAGGGAVPILLALLPLLLSILMALVSVLMFFLMIGLRVVIAIVCVAIAPIAFLCYILPNTQKVFKMWLNAFKAVLVVYPICGLLYGAGKLVKAIIATNSSEITFPLGLICALSPFLPFLIAPSLLRKSLAALGEVGAKLQGLQSGAKGGLRRAQDTATKSDLYKEAMFQGRGKTAQVNVEKTKQKLAEAKKDPNTSRWKLNSLQRKLDNNARAAASYEDEMTKRESSALDQGVYSYIDSNGAQHGVDKYSGADDYAALLEQEAQKDDGEQNAQLVASIKSKLDGFGDEGRNKVEDLVSSGKLKGKALKTVTHSVLSGEGNYKNTNRTLYKAFEDINTGVDPDKAFSQRASAGDFSWLDKNMIRNIDDRELERLCTSGDFNKIASSIDEETWRGLQPKQRDMILQHHKDFKPVPMSGGSGTTDSTPPAPTSPKTYTNIKGGGGAASNREIIDNGDGTFSDKATGKVINNINNYKLDGSEKQYERKVVGGQGKIINTYKNPAGQIINMANGEVVNIDHYREVGGGSS